MSQQVRLITTLSENQLGQRLDQALAVALPNYSRSCIKEWILNQNVLVNGTIWDKPKKRILGGETVTLNVKFEEEISFKAQNIPLNIVYEDEDIIIINKPSNLVVHPGAGNPDGTMFNALLYYHPPIINVFRAGIVHRLDKDTTGLMVVAKTMLAYTRLVKSLKMHKITREYEAIVVGYMISKGTVNRPIRRHPIKRTHMSVHHMGKPAVTHYQVIEHFSNYTRLRLRLETGRTHQIRVHMAHINHPLVGDQVYGTCTPFLKGVSKEFISVMHKFNRQALHATMLRLYHPVTGIEMEWHASMPKDMANIIEVMRANLKENKENYNSVD